MPAITPSQPGAPGSPAPVGGGLVSAPQPGAPGSPAPVGGGLSVQGIQPGAPGSPAPVGGGLIGRIGRALTNKKTVSELPRKGAPSFFGNQQIHSRIPPHSIPPLLVQHPTHSNSISAAVRPFGKPLV